jgi:hypothetical protein
MEYFRMTDRQTAEPAKTDAEIYQDVGKRRWPYVDEPRPTPHRKPRRRPDAGAVPAAPAPRPIAPGGSDSAMHGDQKTAIAWQRK